MAGKILRSIRMRCAFRYIICAGLIILTLVSIQLSFFSEKTLGFFKVATQSRDKLLGSKTDLVNDEKNFTNSSVLPTGGYTGQLDWSQFRHKERQKTGNPLIDNYGQNDVRINGENGRGVTLVGEEKEKASGLQDLYHVNVFASDLIPLNRLVPDARFASCQTTPYPDELPSTSIIIPFHDEWFSILIRTVYSIINRTPWTVLHEIILVDDGSQLGDLRGKLDIYLDEHFPKGLVKLIRLTERIGLIRARLKGWEASTGEVVVFFDSHMEVNINWLPPLLTEVKADRKTVAMGVLDYIQQDTLEYKFYDRYMTRYAFDWRLVFFETFFRPDQIGTHDSSPRIGTVMVGAAYAVDSKYFGEIGAYDSGMEVWGGENLEMAWRIWLCGGRLLHVPCSHIGHVARSQPYTFPGGRQAVEQYNYKRAILVWMEPEYREFVYSHYPGMADLNVGDVSGRLELKKNLNCKPFSWFLKTIWPELLVYNQNVTAWGSARNLNTNRCLDNHQYLFQATEKLFADSCHYALATQGFSLTNEGYLRTSLQCVILKDEHIGGRPMLQDCIMYDKPPTWTHKQSSYLKHEKSGLCLDLDEIGPVMQECSTLSTTQFWQFNTYV